MTLTALLDLHLRPELLETAPGEIKAILTQTRAFEGCLRVDVVEDVTDPAHLLVIEEWESAEADAAYRAWRATPEGASSLGTLLSGPPSLTVFQPRADI